ncbi:MAG: chalcone isomerase family protein [Burkholderiaceae bacterium]
MKSLKQLLAIAALCGVLPAATAAVIDVNGVKYEDTATIRGTPVVLNGAGTRYKAIFKVYTAGLYLGKKADTPEAVIAATGPKRMAIQMLRDIDTKELGKLFTRGVEDNTSRSELPKLIPGLIRMGQIFADHKKLVPGDTFSIEYFPNVGTVITIKGVVQGEPFKEPEFFNAMLSIWLGKNPADANLKEALLGKPTNF